MFPLAVMHRGLGEFADLRGGGRRGGGGGGGKKEAGDVFAGGLVSQCTP